MRPNISGACNWLFLVYAYQEYNIIVIEREEVYPTPVYHSVVSLDRGHDLYNIIHVVVVFEQTRWEAMSRLDCTNSEIPHV